MKFEDKLRERIGTESGYVLPDGSLEALYGKILTELPEQKKISAPKVSTWHRVRPYLYMAAMFAGIWCMMKVFHNVSSPDISLDNPPEFVAEAVMNLPANEYSTYSDFNDFDLEQEMSEQYSDIESFENDFGYELDPEYANADIPDSN